MVRSKQDKSLPRPADIALQVGDTRVVKKLMNNLTLLDMLREFSSELTDIALQDGADGVPMCHYMNKQAKGELELQKTTLQSLGIVGGRVLIRYAKVYLSEDERAQIAKKLAELEEKKAERMKTFELKKLENERNQELVAKREERYAAEREKLKAMRLAEEEEEAKRKAEAMEERATTGDSTSSAVTSTSNTDNTGSMNASDTVSSDTVTNERIEHLRQNRVDTGEFLPEANTIQGNGSLPEASTEFPLRDFKFPSAPSSSPIPKKETVSPTQPDAKKARVEEQAAPPLPETSERNPLYFQLTPGLPRETEDVDDSFFEIRDDDLKTRQRMLSQEVRSTSNQALVPQSFVEERKREQKQAAYRHSVIRFMLPDRSHLQGNFISTESTSELYKFVRQCLVFPEGKSFSLILPAICKVADSPTDDLLKKNIAPKSTLHVKIDTGVEISVKENVTRVTVSEADEQSKQWLSGNTLFIPLEPVIQHNGEELRTAESRQSGGGNFPSRPHTAKKNMPKWFKKGN
uniref:UBX domain-containing protein n=1 Tax=Steinernema glaseri TaxID=37863 RepID=A0A1I7Z4Q8_9BILA